MRSLRNGVLFGRLAQVRPRVYNVMKQIQVWRNHIRIADLDLVLYRAHEEPLARSLHTIARLGFDTRPDNVEVHYGVLSG